MGLCLSLGIATEGSHSSAQEPESRSRCLYAGRHMASKQVPAMLIPGQHQLPVLTSFEHFRQLNGSSRLFAFLIHT